MSTAVTLRGVVHRVFHSSPQFSAGLMKTAQGSFVKFRGAFCANVDDEIALLGRFVNDPKFGRQFNVERISYDLPESPEGLIHYLATHKAFTGIGEATARKLVDLAPTAQGLEALLAGDIAALSQQTKIPVGVLENLSSQWQANNRENRLRTFLASFELTEHQMDVLIKASGEAVVGILRSNPYQLTEMIDGFGFKRVDQIARAMGTPKEHPGRIAAAILYALQEQLQNGHTWVSGTELVDAAASLLVLDTLDARELIQRHARLLTAR